MNNVQKQNGKQKIELHVLITMEKRVQIGKSFIDLDRRARWYLESRIRLKYRIHCINISKIYLVTRQPLLKQQLANLHEKTFIF